MGPSSRYRIYEYLPYLYREGIDFTIKPLLGDWYLSTVWSHKSKVKIGLQIVVAYLKRILSILFLHSDNVVWIGADLLPSFPGWMETYMKMRGIQYVIEFDDAVFHNYDQSCSRVMRWLYHRKFEKVIRNASSVICGCSYLANYSRQWNDNVIIIPTCIDENKYNVTLKNDNNLVVGWIGSPSTSPNICIVVEALKSIGNVFDYELHLVGFDTKYEYCLKGLRYKIIKWSAETEIDNMAQFSIGIMPLQNTPFSQGKCAFKLVQYMAMGIPTISTPLQSNVEINKGCGNLFAKDTFEWIAAFKKLLSNKALREEIGFHNKRIAMKHYTFQATFTEKINVLKSAIEV